MQVFPLLAVLGFALALGSPAGAQVFSNDTTSIPQGSPGNDSFTENVDFADVDLDGDWDAVFADGGDSGNDQNRIWINAGGLQRGTQGVFADETVTRFPAVQDDSRDVEFADIDADGDVDLYVSNTSDLVTQGNRWLVNVGLEQGGTPGFFTDETATRWIGLGAPGSSVTSAAVLPGGGFIDWSCDCDFADLDNDGDLDLVHSSYGVAFGGTVPTRLFLNDGDGFFSEFNPSGFQPLALTLANGQPALWAEGVQQSETTDTTGLFADITLAGLDIELGDIDGDLDIDLVHGDRNAPPRFFQNRLEERGGAPGDLLFRDVSHAVFPPGWATGGGNYEQELGDIDGDDDLDLYGLNWDGFAGGDRMFRNTNGVFGDMTTLPNSTPNDNEGDFFDFDNDGDLDLIVSAIVFGDRLYENVDDGAGAVKFNFVFTAQSGLGFTLLPTLDTDLADLDGDGDYDLMNTREGAPWNQYGVNQTNTPDTTAPRLARLEEVGAPSGTVVASPQPIPVRVQVYDNTPYYLTWYDLTYLQPVVDGCRLPGIPMRSSGGQIFRGELPGNLLGTVTYRALSADEFGNVGTTPDRTYTATTSLNVGGPYGTGTDPGTGEPELRALSVGFLGTTLYVAGTGLPPLAPWFLTLNSAPLTPPVEVPGVGILNVLGMQYFLFTGAADSDGCAVLPLYLPENLPSGAKLYFQLFSTPGPAGHLFSSTKGLEVLLN